MNERTTHTTDSSGNNTGNSWMDHPAINGMDPVKLELIRLAAKQTAGKSGRSLAPVMMALITSANKKRNPVHSSGNVSHPRHPERGTPRQRAGAD